VPRPRKDKVDYFPHYCKHGRTLKIMQSKYGDTSYVFWFRLLELLGDTEGHVFDCNDSANMEFLLTLYAQPTGSYPHSEGLLPVEMLDTLAKLDAIDADLWEHKIIWCQNFVNGLIPVYQNRNRDLPKKPLLPVETPRKGGITTTSYPVHPPVGGITTPGNPHSIVEDSIVEDTKKEASPIADADSLTDEDQYSAFNTPPDPEPGPSIYLPQAERLADKITVNDPKHFGSKDRTNVVTKWADDIRKLVEIDGREVPTVEAVIDWCQDSDFWKSNILSGIKLRKQFPTLLLQMDNNGTGGKPKTPDEKRQEATKTEEGRKAYYKTTSWEDLDE